MEAVVVGNSEGHFNSSAATRFNVEENSLKEKQLKKKKNGFVPFELFSGIYPDSILPEDLDYNDYLHS